MKNKKLLVGFHAINARLWQNASSLSEIYLLESKHDPRTREVLTKAKVEGVKVYRISQDRLQALAPGVRHQGIVAFAAVASLQQSLEDLLNALQEPPLLLLLDGVTDPHNLGAALRVAEAMGVHAVIAPKDKSVGINSTVSKVACGAAESLPYITVTNLVRTIQWLKERKIWIYGTHLEGEESLYEVKVPSGMAWVMGSEGKGLRRLTAENCDSLIRIPMYGNTQSLNVAVSTGIVLAETQRQYHSNRSIPN
ncbi:MAG: 23S rRNA (guanosine(2251)-2'-O)-methyltransferase RlmB [Neisseriaceae bacterium]